MQLTFSRSYLSITRFPSVEIPQFCVISGPNGVGKSHLLQAIYNGAIATDVAPLAGDFQSQMRQFDWNTLVPQETGAFSSEVLRQERLTLQQTVLNLKNQPQIVDPLRSLANSWDLDQETINNPYRLLRRDNYYLQSLPDNSAELTDSQTAINTAAAHAEALIVQQLDVPSQKILRALSEKFGVGIAGLTERELTSGSIPNWGRTDLFQQSFARLFVAYRDAYISNLLTELRFKSGDSDQPPLDSEAFVKQHGPAPWDFVNETIRIAGLGFTINSPNMTDFDPYTPVLTKSSTGVAVPFGTLSSGEKILMSFAFCVYYSNNRRQLASYPKVILFDEIDAPLHPSMTKGLVETIQRTLVDDFGINVICTTHSPSTVALAPEGSVHLMLRDIPGLHKTSKAKALNLLTEGVPTLAISYSGRRQVFVESPTDAKLYDLIYTRLKTKLDSERSLEFVSTGVRSQAGQEVNTGCDAVKRLVNDLASTGNQSVFGLLDWDGKAKSSDRIFVLAEGERNGLENCILDPLALGGILIRDCPSENKFFDSAISYAHFLQLDVNGLQNIARSICEAVFDDSGSTIHTRYTGGFSLQIDSRFLKMDDHLLEATILKNIPALRSVAKSQSGQLSSRIVSTIFIDRVEIIPLAFYSLFSALLEVDPHF